MYYKQTKHQHFIMEFTDNDEDKIIYVARNKEDALRYLKKHNK